MKWSPPHPAYGMRRGNISRLLPLCFSLCICARRSHVQSFSPSFKRPWTLRSVSRLLFVYLLFPWSHEDTATVEITSPCALREGGDRGKTCEGEKRNGFYKWMVILNAPEMKVFLLKFWGQNQKSKDFSEEEWTKSTKTKNRLLRNDLEAATHAKVRVATW